MKRTTIVLGLVLVLATAVSAVAGPGLLGIRSLLGVNKPETFIDFNPGDQVAFDAATRDLAVDAVPGTTNFGSHIRTIVGGDVQIRIRVLDDQANAVAGSAGDDFIMTGAVDIDGNGAIDPVTETGTLLTGEIVELGWFNQANPAALDLLDLRFRPTGGFMAPLYGGASGGAIGVVINLEASSWAAGQDFGSSFTARPKGSILPVCGGAIGDFVWEDVNYNGVQDPLEAPIANVSLTLTDNANNPLATAMTDVNGRYLFTKKTNGVPPGTDAALCPGTYKVVVTPPVGYYPTKQCSTVLGDPNYDANCSASKDSNPSPAPVTLTVSQPEDKTIDFGLIRPAQLGDRVWHDRNVNGIQENGEEGLNGVSVTLSDCSGNPVTNILGLAVPATVTANLGSGDGYYLFSNLKPGCYQVQFGTHPTYTARTLQGQGGNPAVDSDASVVNGRTGNITLASGQSDLTWDAGLYQPAELGDRVWFDTNGNGRQDGGEPDKSGVIVELFQCGGPAPIASRTTDANGFYLFDNLAPGQYSVRFTLPSGFLFTSKNAAGTNFMNDSDAIPSGMDQGQTTCTTLDEGESDRTWDAGLVSACSATIGDFVWYDLNLNGRQDAGEPGLAGAEITLTDAADNVVGTQITGANGAYLFSNLPCGVYTVEVTTPPPSAPGDQPFSPTATLVGSGDKDSNPSPFTVDMTAGGENRTIDFGYLKAIDFCPLGTDTPSQSSGALLYSVDPVTGDVWVRYDQANDVNDNSYGINAVGWPSGHTFGNLVGSDQAVFQFRNKNGALVLDFDVDYISLKAGTPSGYDSLGVLGGEGNMNVGSASHVLYATSSLAQTLNFGTRTDNNVPFCSGGVCTVNGLNLLVNSPPTVNSGSYALPGGSVFGNWNFTNSYIVKVSGAAFASGGGFGSVVITDQHNSPAKRRTDGLGICPTDGGTGGTCQIVGSTSTVDKKELRWPLKNNGSAKATLSQVTVTWPASNGYLDKVKFDKDVVWDGTINCVGSSCSATITSAMMTSDAKKKSIDKGKTRKLIFVFQNDVSAGSAIYSATADFGTGCLVSLGEPPTSCTGIIGDYVWIDDGDGIQELGEPGIAGLSLVLKENGTTKATATTNANGLYQFANVCAGTYTVELSTPFGYVPTITSPPGVGIPSNDSNPNPATVVLPADDSQDLTIDFGFVSGGGIPMCPTTAITGFGPANPVGLLYVTDNGNNTVTVRYEQNTLLNDNSYGVNAVGWANGHTWSNLTGSDSAQFTFFNGAGTKVLDFEIDYISAKSGTASGYGTLGVAGGDGGMLVGNASHVLSAMTSLDASLNSTGLCAAGNCSGGGTNLLVNSPPTVSNSSYALPGGSPYGAWQFMNWYQVTVSKALLTGNWRVQMGVVHNSPPKAGSNAVYPVPCQ